MSKDTKKWTQDMFIFIKFYFNTMDYFQRYKQNKQSIVVERPNCSMNI